MLNKYCYQAVDRLFRDLCDQDVPFGGNRVVLLGGDYRQLLHIVRRGSIRQIIGTTLPFSELWENMDTILTLSKNMRVHKLAALGHEVGTLEDFADYLLKIGEGRE